MQYIYLKNEITFSSLWAFRSSVTLLNWACLLMKNSETMYKANDQSYTRSESLIKEIYIPLPEWWLKHRIKCKWACMVYNVPDFINNNGTVYLNLYGQEIKKDYWDHQPSIPKSRWYIYWLTKHCHNYMLGSYFLNVNICLIIAFLYQ